MFLLSMISLACPRIKRHSPPAPRVFLGCLRQASRDDVLDALDELDADRQQPGRPTENRRGEESKDGGGGRSGTGGVDLVAFIRLMRQRPRQNPGLLFPQEVWGLIRAQPPGLKRPEIRSTNEVAKGHHVSCPRLRA